MADYDAITIDLSVVVPLTPTGALPPLGASQLKAVATVAITQLPANGVLLIHFGANKEGVQVSAGMSFTITPAEQTGIFFSVPTALPLGALAQVVLGYDTTVCR